MANRYTYQFKGSFEAGVVSIFSKIAFGVAAAPSLVAGQNKGIASVARTGVGTFEIVLQDSFVRLLQAGHCFLGVALAAAPLMQVQSDASASTKIITVQFRDVTGAAADPASGDVVMIDLQLKNSSA